MKHKYDVDLREIWLKVPARRRHFYFFLLLGLVTVVLANLQDLAAFGRLIPPTPAPPRITSQEVYPAPVNL